MSLQPFKKQKIEKNEESLLLNLFDFNIIQHVFVQLPNSHFFYEDIKDCYSDCSSFSLTSKLFNSISKQTQFSIKVFQNQKIDNINFDGYLKLCSILQQKAIKDKTFKSKEEIVNHILIHVSAKGFYNLIETLILNGADPNFDDKTAFIYTPLCLSCARGNYKTTKLLISNNSNVNYKDYENQTLLHFACGSGNLKLVKYLLHCGLDVNSLTDEEETPLFQACRSGNINLVKYLINEKKVNIHQETVFDETILFNTCGSGNLDLLKYLIFKKHLDIYHENSYGRTLLFTAIYSRNIQLIDFLLSEELEIDHQDYEFGNTTLYYACTILQDLEIIKHLISKGANLKIKYEDNKNILEIAKDAGNQDIIQELQKKFDSLLAKKKKM